jgi:hypothetical protein
MILQIFCAFVFGMFGAFLFPTISFDQNLSNFPLWLLLFCVGLDCGKNKDIFPALKKYGLVIFLIPVCILISSLFGAFIAGAIVGNPANLSFAVGSVAYPQRFMITSLGIFYCTVVILKPMSMTLTKKSVVTAAIIATLGFGALGATTVFAASDAAGEHNPMQNLVSAIATKFHLDEKAVQAVFDEQRDTMHEERQVDAKEHLAKAVTDGKLTQAQADAIAANMETQKVFFESLKDMSPSERDAAIQENMKAQKTWAEEQGLPKELAPFEGHDRPAFSGRMHGKRGMMDRVENN